mgnify:CR=1 FL=1
MDWRTVDRWAEKYGERIAVTDSEDEISYMELKQKADCLAAAFLRKGILRETKCLCSFRTGFLL